MSRNEKEITGSELNNPITFKSQGGFALSQ